MGSTSINDTNRVIWLLNNSCPNSCPYCGVKKSHAQIDAESLHKIADQIVNNKFTEVILCGGEPLLTPSLPGIIERLSKKCITALFTGGIPHSEQILNQSIKSGLSRIVFSVDSCDMNLNDELRGRKKATEDINRQIAFVIKNYPKFNFSINTVVTNKNLNFLPALWKRIKLLKPISWSLTLVGENMDYFPELFLLSKEQLDFFYFSLIPTLNEDARLSGIELYILPSPLVLIRDNNNMYRLNLCNITEEVAHYSSGKYNKMFLSHYKCTLAGNDITIDHEGNIYPCSQAPIIKRDYIIGNILEDTLPDIINSQKMVSFLKMMPYNICERCWLPSNISKEKLNIMLKESHEP